jgi:cytochrome P450
VTRYHDVIAVGRDWEMFTSAQGANIEELEPEHLETRRSMLETDGPRHRALRRLLIRDFSPKSLGRYETFLRGIAGAALDCALAKGEFDFVTEVSSYFPGRMTARMLNVPEPDINKLIEWGNRLVSNSDPELADVVLYSEESERYRDLPFRSPTSLDLYAYGEELGRKRRGGSGDDLVSRLVNTAPEDGIALSEQDFRNYFLTLIVAGNETSQHALSTTVLALIEHPEQLALLHDRPELMSNAVEEFLRWSSPVYQFRRTATRDIELHGHFLRKGDKVVTWLASANRDESIFDDPYRFDVTRAPNEHLAFGHGGPHFCLGSALGRMEIRIIFEELVARLSHIELAGQVSWVRSNFVNGPKNVPIRVKTR